MPTPCGRCLDLSRGMWLSYHNSVELALLKKILFIHPRDLTCISLNTLNANKLHKVEPYSEKALSIRFGVF